MGWRKDREVARINQETAQKAREDGKNMETCTGCNGTGKVDGKIHGPCWGSGERRIR